MGEEAKQEQAPAEAKPKAEETKTEETKTDGKEGTPKPPTPIVLQVDLHCVGCAKKIERSIMRLKGVDGVVVDMGQNQLTIRGAVDPQAVCDKVTKKTKKSARVLSPLPAPESDPAKPDVAVASEAVVLTSVELVVNMHCEACAAQLKRKILKMRGVQTAETELSSGKVTVTGTMNADKLVDYVYRRTKKQARIVPQLEPPKPAPEEGKKAAEDEKAPGPEDANKEAATPPQAEEKKEENGKADEKTESAGGGEAAAAAAEGDKKGEGKEEKKESEGDEAEKKGEETLVNNPPAAMINFGFHNDGETMKPMMTYYYQPLYVIERVPPPQLFSDENPNACCIS